MQAIKTIFLLLLAVTFAVSCSKDNDKKPSGEGYIATWQQIAIKISPGTLVTE